MSNISQLWKATIKHTKSAYSWNVSPRVQQSNAHLRKDTQNLQTHSCSSVLRSFRGARGRMHKCSPSRPLPSLSHHVLAICKVKTLRLACRTYSRRASFTHQYKRRVRDYRTKCATNSLASRQTITSLRTFLQGDYYIARVWWPSRVQRDIASSGCNDLWIEKCDVCSAGTPKPNDIHFTESWNDCVAIGCPTAIASGILFPQIFPTRYSWRFEPAPIVRGEITRGSRNRARNGRLTLVS